MCVLIGSCPSRHVSACSCLILNVWLLELLGVLASDQGPSMHREELSFVGLSGPDLEVWHSRLFIFYRLNQSHGYVYLQRHVGNVVYLNTQGPWANGLGKQLCKLFSKW